MNRKGISWGAPVIEVVLTACSAAAAQGVMMCNAMQWATGRLLQKITCVSAMYLSQHINQETLLHVERMEIESEFVIVALQLTRVAPLPHEIVFCSRPKLAVFTSMGISLHKQLDCRVLGRNTNPGIPL